MTTRIEEIKRDFEIAKEDCEGDICFVRMNANIVQELLDRVEELEKENTELRKVKSVTDKSWVELQGKLTVAVEALEFYADLTIMPNNEAYFFGVRVTEGVNELGHKAREALKKIV